MKKILSILLSLVLLASFAPTQAYAATDKNASSNTASIAVGEPTGTKDTDPTDASLQKAIVAVKERITIPSSYSDFNYNYYDGNTYLKPYWYLYWTNPTSGANIVVNCDVDHHITYYSKYDYSGSNRGLAKYLKSELEETAQKFITKIAPETKSSLKLVSSEYTYLYSGDYVYTYQRVQSGVDFPDNTVTVYVNSFTGEVTSASVNWLYDATLPAAKAELTKEKATAIIKANMKMKLVYHSNYYSIYDKFGNLQPKEAFLVYEPSESYISIDAKTGEIYKTKNEWSETNGAAMNYGYSKEEAAKDTAAATTSYVLTGEEIKKIEELKNIISKSEAIKVITGNKSLYQDSNLSQTTANLTKVDDGFGSTSYVWNITLNDPREITEKDYFRGYAYATVDAKSGKILSYYASVKSNYDNEKQKWNTVKIKYDKKQSREIFEKFLKSQAKERFNSSVLSKETEDYIAYYQKETPVYGGYYFAYNRVYSGIEYADNGLYGAVDGITGKIYSFSTNWNDKISFQSAKGAITADQAMDYYLGKDGYGLKYEINSNTKYSTKTGTSTVKNEVRLVYQPNIVPSYISPFTGEQLDYSGEVYQTVAKKYAYKDITNTEANRTILLLADMNIGFEGENFLPKEYVTVDQIKALLNGIGYYYDTEKTKDNSVITREGLANLIVKWLSLEKLAALDIYTTGYADQSSIDSKYLGAVALTKGLGIMTADSENKFNPKNNVTRYEAVNIVVNFIKAQVGGTLSY